MTRERHAERDRGAGADADAEPGAIGLESVRDVFVTASGAARGMGLFVGYADSSGDEITLLGNDLRHAQSERREGRVGVHMSASTG